MRSKRRWDIDLHVVELKVNVPEANVHASVETDVFRNEDVYAAARGSTSFVRPVLDPSELGDNPIETLALLGGRIADSVAAGLRSGRRVVIAGGNCTSLPGIIGGLQQFHGAGARIGLVWFDAHGDFNTPGTSLTGRLGGMPVAVSAGLCYPEWRGGAHQDVVLPTDRIVMVDVRNLDPAENQLIQATVVTVVPVAGSELNDAVRELAGKTDVVYLHVDLDVLDEAFAPSHDTKEPNGPDIDTVVDAIQTVLNTHKVEAVGLVAIYPIREGAETSLASATTLLREMIRRWELTERATVIPR